MTTVSDTLLSLVDAGNGKETFGRGTPGAGRARQDEAAIWAAYLRAGGMTVMISMRTPDRPTVME